MDEQRHPMAGNFLAWERAATDELPCGARVFFVSKHELYAYSCPKHAAISERRGYLFPPDTCNHELPIHFEG